MFNEKDTKEAEGVGDMIDDELTKEHGDHEVDINEKAPEEGEAKEEPNISTYPAEVKDLRGTKKEDFIRGMDMNKGRNDELMGSNVIGAIAPPLLLTVAVLPGMFLLGTIHPGELVERLHNPRILTLLQGGKQIQLAPLPGTPPCVELSNTVATYEMPLREKQIYDLYAQVTDRKVDPNHPEHPNYAP